VTGDQHPRHLLAALVNGTLPAADRRAVQDHLRACASCRLQRAEWRALADGARRAAAEALLAEPLSDPAPYERIERDLAPLPAGPPERPLRHALAVLRGQVRLVHGGIWPASALVMTLGFAVCLLSRGALVGLVFTLFVPAVAAAAVALVYGPEADPSLELALATTTSPRTILLARLTLVFGFDLVLAALASAAVSVFGLAPGGLVALVELWLGPMLLLSAGTLLVSLYLGSAPALLAAIVIWTIRTSAEFGGAGEQPAGHVVAQVWSTGPLTLGLAAGLFALALATGTGRERLA
jgi:hypothetical protein